MGTIVKEIAQNVAQKETLINEINQALSPAARFGRRNVDNPGLYYYYYGGRMANASGVAVDIANGSILCVANTTNYVEFQIGTGMVVNQTAYTVGNIPVARCITNASTIVTFYNDVIDAFLPTGVSPALSSGGSSNAFGDITVVNNLVGPTPGNTLFQVKGGKNWTTGKVIRESNAVSVPDYSSTSDFSYLTASKVYYVFLDLYTNTIKTQDASSVITLTTNGKLLWIIETDTTKISKVTDYRLMNIFIKNKSLIKANTLTTGPTSYVFNMSEYFYQNQVADADSMTAVSGQFPRYIVPNMSLLCLIAEKGYSVGEEADYITSDSMGVAWGKPYRIQNNGNLHVYQGNSIMVWNNSTNSWEVPTTANWAITCKLHMEYHS